MEMGISLGVVTRTHELLVLLGNTAGRWNDCRAAIARAAPSVLVFNSVYAEKLVIIANYTKD
jgi:hypothetical protein